MTLTELAERVGVTVVNLSVLKNGRARAVRFSTLSAICEVLDCQPGDVLKFRAERGESPKGSRRVGDQLTRSHVWCVRSAYATGFRCPLSARGRPGWAMSTRTR